MVTVDPPRKGLSSDAIEALSRMAPRRIVYVSCDPATLARDVALLKEKGYTLRSVQAADLFPRCAHVETVVLMGKTVTRSKSHVDLGLDVEDYYKIKDAEKEQE